MMVPSRPSSRALFEARHDLHHALFHRDLDVLAAPHGALQ
jgi:Zn-dependent peptidase ImmA (M78 family)